MCESHHRQNFNSHEALFFCAFSTPSLGESSVWPTRQKGLIFGWERNVLCANISPSLQGPIYCADSLAETLRVWDNFCFIVTYIVLIGWSVKVFTTRVKCLEDCDLPRICDVPTFSSVYVLASFSPETGNNTVVVVVFTRITRSSREKNFAYT